MSAGDLLNVLYDSIGMRPHDLRSQTDGARIEVHANRILGVHLVPGLEVEAQERKDGIEAALRVKQGARIEKPIQVCFGMVPESGVQEIVLEVDVEQDAQASILAYCTFPNARKIRHEMQAVLRTRRAPTTRTLNATFTAATGVCSSYRIPRSSSALALVTAPISSSFAAESAKSASTWR